MVRYSKGLKDEIVRRSHERSIEYGIERERIRSKRLLNLNEVKKVLEKSKNLIKVAKPFIENLYETVKGSGFFIVITDEEGCILDILGDYTVLSVAKNLGMIKGAYMDERSIGTNAMAVTIKEDIPIQLSAKEHYIKAYHKWTCSAAPIHDGKGHIIGALNLTGYSEEVHLHTLGMVVAAVQSIEGQLFKESMQEIQKTINLVNKSSSKISRYTFENMLYNSDKMDKIVEYAKSIACSPSTVLIQGESGTGKEVLAQSIHNASNRMKNSFIVINCGAIPKNLIESELFGYEEGAFTGAVKGGMAGKFELANGGTLFLDEIGEMPIDMQVNLLRVLQEGYICRVGGNRYIPVDVRIIAATNKNLLKEIEKGNFREDLFYRLSVLPITIPPLRHRKEDLEILTQHFLKSKAYKLNKPIPEVNHEVLRYIYKHEWKGNIRELENYIENIVNFNGKATFEVKNGSVDKTYIQYEYETSDNHNNSSGNNNGNSNSNSNSNDVIYTLQEIEKKAIENYLERFKGNISKTAKALDISRNTLYLKTKKYGINVR